MKRLRAIIADDEPLARQRLRTLLIDESDIEIAAECDDGLSTLNAIEAQRPDLVLLDIQMPGLDGFQVLERIEPALRPVVVFVTAYDEHALRAFEASAIDYLLKPVDAARLREAIARVRRQADPQGVVGRIETLLRAAAAQNNRPPTLLVREEDRWTLVPAAEVDWIEADGKYVKLHCGRKVHLLRESIGRLEERLSTARFVRIHRSTLVNLDRIAHLEPAFHGDMSVELRDGTRLMLSRAYRDRLRDVLGG